MSSSSTTTKETKRPASSFRDSLLEKCSARQAAAQIMMMNLGPSDSDTESDNSSAVWSSQSSSSNKSGRVRFSNTLVVYEHAYILGDNPSVNEGVPLTLEWSTQRKKKYNFEERQQKKEKLDLKRERESVTQGKTAKGGRSSHFKLGMQRRAELALMGGCSLQEMGQVITEILEIRTERAKSGKKSNWELWKGGFAGKQRGDTSSLLSSLPSLRRSAPAAA